MTSVAVLQSLITVAVVELSDVVQSLKVVSVDELVEIVIARWIGAASTTKLDTENIINKTNTLLLLTTFSCLKLLIFIEVNSLPVLMAMN